MANFVYTKAKVKFAKAVMNLLTDTLKLALMTSSYSPNQDSDDTFSGISGNEVTGTGYTAGGQALTTVAVAADNPNHRMKMTADNVVWSGSTITFRYAVLYDTVGGDLIALYDPGTTVSDTAGTLTVTWDATNGVLDLA